MKQIGALEPKPGVPPTSAHLASLIAITKSSNTLAIIRAAYQDPKASEWLSERTGVPAVSLPFTVGGDPRVEGSVRHVRLHRRQVAWSGKVNLQLNWEGLDISILGPACLAGLIVLSTHVPLGKQVLARGIIFIDLAIAQIAALGVISAGFFGIDEHGLGVQVAAAIAALLGAGLLAWTDRRWPEYQEPLIGTLFVLAATGGIAVAVQQSRRAAST